MFNFAVPITFNHVVHLCSCTGKAHHEFSRLRRENIKITTAVTLCQGSEISFQAFVRGAGSRDVLTTGFKGVVMPGIDARLSGGTAADAAPAMP